jgi:hypothetical protein
MSNRFPDGSVFFLWPKTSGLLLQVDGGSGFMQSVVNCGLLLITLRKTGPKQHGSQIEVKEIPSVGNWKNSSPVVAEKSFSAEAHQLCPFQKRAN